MSARYCLHYAPDNASLIVRIVMDMIGAAYETRLVDRSVSAQSGAAYKALNPLGMIPALETPDGVLFETGAILLWLTDRHGAGFPSVDDPKRGDALKWLFFISNSLHAGLRQMFYPEKFVSEDAAPALRAGIAKRIGADFAVVDGLIAKGEVFGTGDAPALDVYLCCLKRWATLYPGGEWAGWADLSAYPHLQKLTEEMDLHPAVQYAARAEGLGNAPFSEPHLPNPPEGSAT